MGIVSHGYERLGATTSTVFKDEKESESGEEGKTAKDPQKETVPRDVNMIARPTKNGPAAPVTLSANLSSRLKHRKTNLERKIGIYAVVVSKIFNCPA